MKMGKGTGISWNNDLKETILLNYASLVEWENGMCYIYKFINGVLHKTKKMK